MERVLIYMLAILDILIGFLIFYRGAGRFGLWTYKSFLDWEENEDRRTEKAE